MKRSYRTPIRNLTIALLAGSLIGAGAVVPAHASDPAVDPIAWSAFTAGLPTDTESLRMRAILTNANEYALTTWWNTTKNFDAQGGSTYLSFGGTAEGNIRPPAGEALALATALSTGAYNATATGVPVSTATDITVKLVRSLAYRHVSNGAGGWGNDWQSGLWASYAGMAGWMIWDELPAADAELVRKMVEYEANRFIGVAAPYWNTGGGDSKGEENSWNAMVLQVATAMMPDHANYAAWMDRELEYMISAYSRPGDSSNSTVVNGKPLSTWIPSGKYNVNADGTMINHDLVHPDYMATLVQNVNAALTSTLAGAATPAAAFHNADVVYDALVDHNFVAGTKPYPQAPTIASPGGTIFTPGSSAIYYLNGNDWGTDRRMHFATLDAMAAAFGFDDLVSNGGSYWEPYHAQKVADMQARFTDGHTYGATAEDTYTGREEWLAVHAAQGYLTKWVTKQGAFSMTNAAYPVPSAPASGSTINDTNPAITYSGAWTANAAAPGRIGGDEHFASAAGAYAELTFTGPSITWIGTKFSNRGKADVYIDGVLQTTVDLYDPGTVNQVPLFVKAGLSSGSHTLRITVTGTKSAASTGTFVVIDALVVGSTINDTNPAITYSGAWTANAAAPGRIGGDEHFASAAGAYAELTFTGPSITWIGTKFSNRGKADVYIDGVLQTTVDLYDPGTVNQVPLFVKTGLSSGSHTLRITVTGTKSAASTGTFVVIDALG